MLLYCLKDGLTSGARVMARGEVFKMPDQLLKECEELSDEQLAKFNKRNYGEQVFRRPTAAELTRAYHKDKKFIMQNSTKREKELIFRFAKAVKEKKEEELQARIQADFAEEVDAEEINQIVAEEMKKEEKEPQKG